MRRRWDAGTSIALRSCRTGSAQSAPTSRFRTTSERTDQLRRIGSAAPVPEGFTPSGDSLLSPNAGSSSVLDVECVAERVIESDPRSEVEVPDRFGVKQHDRDGYQIVAADHARRG